MDIYDLLMFIVQRLTALGPVHKEQAFNAIDLIKQLKRMNAFGEIGRITTGSHQYQRKYIGEFGVTACGICGRQETEHE